MQIALSLFLSFPIPIFRQVDKEDLPGHTYEDGEEERYEGERLAASMSMSILPTRLS